MLILLIAALTSGPISKFDGRHAESEYDSPATAGEIERCLIDMSGMTLPQVYRQPDRPNIVTLIWQTHGPLSASAANRVDLTTTATGTHVKGWFSKDDLEECAPR